MRLGERSTCIRLGRVLRPLILACAVSVAAFAFPASAQSPKHAPIRLVFADELAPLSFREGEEVKGILVDVAREVFQTRLGLDVKTATYPWQRAQQMVREGKADGFITIATTERAAYANCGRIPVLRSDLRPIVRPDNPRLDKIKAAQKLADLRPFEIVSYAGNGWAKQNLEGFNVFYAADFQSSLRGVAQGRGDLSLGTITSGAYYMQEPDLQGKLEMLPLVVDTFQYVLCLGKESLHVGKLAEFERVLEVMRMDGGYPPILQRYGMAPETLY